MVICREVLARHENIDCLAEFEGLSSSCACVSGGVAKSRCTVLNKYLFYRFLASHRGREGERRIFAHLPFFFFVSVPLVNNLKTLSHFGRAAC